MGRDDPKITKKQRQRMRKKEEKNTYDKYDNENEHVRMRQNEVPNNGDWTPLLFHMMRAEGEVMYRYEEEFGVDPNSSPDNKVIQRGGASRTIR